MTRSLSSLRVLALLLSLLLVFSASAQDEGTGEEETQPTGEATPDDNTGEETEEEETQPAGGETAPSTTEAGPTSADPADTSAPPVTRAATEQRLREMATQVDEFKEETFGTKSRLLLLREQVLRRTIAGSKIAVFHVNEIGDEYELVQVLYALDGQRKKSYLDYSGKLSDMNNQLVFEDTIVPGSHVLMVEMVFKGSSWFFFEYMDGYTFTVKSSYLFEADEGKLHEFTVIAKEDGDFFTALEERPTIVYEEIIVNYEAEGQPEASNAP